MVFLRRIDRDQTGPIDRVPEICVEVLSANRAYDRVTKRFVYAGSGVAEYWLADPAGLIERWSGPGLGRDETLTESLSSPLLPEFTLDLRRLFADVG
jgi:Uma2 family endonuclease